MKSLKMYALLSISLLSFTCDDAIDEINDCEKPCVVFSKYKSDVWYLNSQMTIKDGSGELIKLPNKNIDQLVEKYNVGDTIK